MFYDATLDNHLANSSVVRLQSAVIAEWNMNDSANIATIGNYRYRPLSTGKYSTAISTYDKNDDGNFYTGATDADVVVDGGFDKDNIPMTFSSNKEKQKLLFSLEDCFNRFRPRSGINKIVYGLNNKVIHHSNQYLAQRPRYYMADKNDKFKYWSSFRTESGSEYGVANQPQNASYYIDDAAPFVVYKTPVPANRVVVKMQTNSGTIDLGPFSGDAGTYTDPLYGFENQTTPKIWKIQYLDNNNWADLISFNAVSRRADGSPVIGSDGYVEVAYGLIVPERYRSGFVDNGELMSANLLPQESIQNYAFLVYDQESDTYKYYVWFNGAYESFSPTYGWQLAEEAVTQITNFVSDLTSPPRLPGASQTESAYRDFQYVGGLRVVVDAMNKMDSTFDLIELSPRLAVDLSGKTTDFSISKSSSDLGISGMPVGQLLASTGTLSLFDYDQAFNINNTESIISKYSSKNVQIKFYEIIAGVEGRTSVLNKVFYQDYYVPMKTMYVEGFPITSGYDRQVSIKLRDMFTYFESTTAPQILIKDASLSYAVSMLLDSVGFSNYVFNRLDGESDPMIPYFFIGPDKTVAQVLNELAISTQTAMFFDEYNNFIMMSKNYAMPAEGQRETTLNFRGSDSQPGYQIIAEGDGISETSAVPFSKTDISNIIEISAQDNNVFNDGKINYTTRYIQKTYGSVDQAYMLDRDKTWVYKPSLLWEVAGKENTKSVNDVVGTQSSYTLSAIPLSSSLSTNVPSVQNHQIINNIMDLGEAVYWMTRYNGYFYANGEIIKYDAIEYSISGIGNVWISSAQEYGNYFSKITFAGKLYPTGRVRIYAEPKYESISGQERMANGAVTKHGRGQFGTSIVSHSAGLDPYWSDNANVRGVSMKSEYLFSNPDLSISGVSSEGTTLKCASITGLEVGQKITIEPARVLVEISPNPQADIRITAVPTEKLEGEDFYRVIVNTAPSPAMVNETININTLPLLNETNKALLSKFGASGVSKSAATKATRTGVMKNFLSTSYSEDSDTKVRYTTDTDTVQASALIMSGPTFDSKSKPLDFLSYVYKPLTNSFKHFGTRLRIIGRVENSETTKQNAAGSMVYANTTSKYTDAPATVSGGAAGLAVMVNPETNNGYYLEIAALASDNVADYTEQDLRNVYFYKIMQNASFDLESATNIAGVSDGTVITASANGILTVASNNVYTGQRIKLSAQTDATQNGFYTVTNPGSISTKWVITRDEEAIPVKLWSGLTQILVDEGTFAGQGRIAAEDKTTVYDLAVEYEKVGSARRFYIYLNNNQIATVLDEDPLAVYNGMGLFVRGSSKAMFENIYALSNNYSQNSSFVLDATSNSVFGTKEINVSESFKKYSISGMIQSTYLSGISPSKPPEHNIYYDEFGTIMREADYLNVRYDKAYPALYARLAPTFNMVKGYTTSGFFAGAYGAEFLVFNATDTALNLDESSGNFLRIQGITFTQDSQHEFTVDEYFSKVSDFSDQQYEDSLLEISPIKSKTDYQDIKNSRLTYGRNEFSLDAPYIQTQDDATEMMQWMISKIMKPRKSVGIRVFANPTIQLGDIATITFKNENGIDEIASETSRFVVYNISYSRKKEGPDMTVYLSEII